MTKIKKYVLTMLMAVIVTVSGIVPKEVSAYSSIYTNDPGLYTTFDQFVVELQNNGTFTIPTNNGTQANIIYDKFRLYFLGSLGYRYSVMRVRGGYRVTPAMSIDQIRTEVANHYTAKTIVDAFTVEVSGMSYEEKVNFFTKYLCSYVEYDHQGLAAEKAGIGSASRSVYTLFSTQTAVCEGYAKAFYALCAAAGIQIRYVEGYSGRGVGHAWNEVFIPDQGWFLYDITYTDGGVSSTKVAVPYNNQGGV